MTLTPPPTGLSVPTPVSRAGQRLGTGTLAATGLAVALMVITAGMGPSNAVPETGARLSLHLHPSPWLIVPLVWTIAVLGGVAPGLGLLAIRRGWRPAPRKLLLAVLPAVALLAILPVAGSTDVLSYAVYGRIGAIGHDPASWVPWKLIRIHDPVGTYAPAAWRSSPSVYGPVANGLFGLAALICGASMAKIVFLLKLVMGAAFASTAWALDRLAGPEEARRVRVHVLWTLNPAMLWACVVGGHIDVLAAGFMIAALFVLHGDLRTPRWWPRLLLAGALVGTAAAIKAPLVLAGLGLAWTLRRSLRDLLALAVGGAAVIGTAYLLAGRSAVHVLRARSDSASPISPWRLPLHLFGDRLWETAPMSVIGLVAGVAMMLLLAWRLPAAHPGLPEVRPMLVLLCGWLVVSPLQRPWYDTVIFTLLALMPSTRIDGILVARGSVGMFGFLPGVPSPQPHPYPGPMDWVAHVFVPWIVSLGSSVMVVLIGLRLVRHRARGVESAQGPADQGMFNEPRRADQGTFKEPRSDGW